VSTAPEAVPDADHIFVGEAEETLPEFVADLIVGAARPVYRASERPALSRTPVADFGLVDRRHYSSMSIQYSRGCPFQCEFCDIIEIYGRVPRTKSNEQVLAELDALLAAGWRGLVFIVDDNFIGNKKYVKRLLPALEEWSERNDRPFYFATEASVNLADDDALLEMMRRAGFYRVFLGIETPVEESLKEALKGQNTKRNLVDSVRKIQSYGMEVMAGFIVGFDSDPDDIFERQVDFIRESAIPLAMVGLLTALPDTQLWRRLERGAFGGREHGRQHGWVLEFRAEDGGRSARRGVQIGAALDLQSGGVLPPGAGLARAGWTGRGLETRRPEPRQRGRLRARGDGAWGARRGAARVLEVPSAGRVEAPRQARARGDAGRHGVSLPQAYRGLLRRQVTRRCSGAGWATPTDANWANMRRGARRMYEGRKDAERREALSMPYNAEMARRSEGA